MQYFNRCFVTLALIISAFAGCAQAPPILRQFLTTNSDPIAFGTGVQSTTNLGKTQFTLSVSAAGTNGGTVTNIAIASDQLTVSGSPISVGGTITIDIPKLLKITNGLLRADFAGGTYLQQSFLNAPANPSAWYFYDSKFPKNVLYYVDGIFITECPWFFLSNAVVGLDLIVGGTVTASNVVNMKSQVSVQNDGASQPMALFDTPNNQTTISNLTVTNKLNVGNIGVVITNGSFAIQGKSQVDSNLVVKGFFETYGPSNYFQKDVAIDGTLYTSNINAVTITGTFSNTTFIGNSTYYSSNQFSGSNNFNTGSLFLGGTNISDFFGGAALGTNNPIAFASSLWSPSNKVGSAFLFQDDASHWLDNGSGSMTFYNPTNLVGAISYDGSGEYTDNNFWKEGTRYYYLKGANDTKIEDQNGTQLLATGTIIPSGGGNRAIFYGTPSTPITAQVYEEVLRVENGNVFYRGTNIGTLLGSGTGGQSNFVNVTATNAMLTNAYIGTASIQTLNVTTNNVDVMNITNANFQNLTVASLVTTNQTNFGNTVWTNAGGTGVTIGTNGSVNGLFIRDTGTSLTLQNPRPANITSNFQFLFNNTGGDVELLLGWLAGTGIKLTANGFRLILDGTELQIMGSGNLAAHVDTSGNFLVDGLFLPATAGTKGIGNINYPWLSAWTRSVYSDTNLTFGFRNNDWLTIDTNGNSTFAKQLTVNGDLTITNNLGGTTGGTWGTNGNLTTTGNLNIGQQSSLGTNALLTAPQWIDLSIPSSILGTAAGTPSDVAIGNVGTGIGAKALAYDRDDYSYGNTQFPHNVAETNALFPNWYFSPHIHICPATNVNLSATGSNVTWRMEWELTPIGTNVAGGMTGTNEVHFQFNGVNTNAGYHSLVSLGKITNNLGLNMLSADFRFRIGRSDINNASNYSSLKLPLMYIDLHVPVGNKTLLGSRQETVQ